MSVSSRPVIHPVEVEAPPPPLPPPTEAAAAAAAEPDAVRPRGVRMRDVPGMPGTTGGLALRVLQFFFAAAALAIMASTSDFGSVTTFRYFVTVVGLQCLWSLSLAIIDAYALLVGRHLRNRRVASVFTIGDGVTSTLTFGAACASAGITVLIGNDMNDCAQNYCTRFEMATAMAFLSWFAVSPSFLFNFWTLASR